MLTVVTVSELLAGTLSAMGVIGLVLGNTALALAGVALSSLSLVMLFFGQRLAKDYAGAAVLVPYFTLTVIGLYLYA